MIEKRAFHRVPFATKVILADDNIRLLGRLENISIGGAMVRLENYPLPSLGSTYWLTVQIEESAPPLQMITEIACVSASSVGLRFTSIDQDTRERLEKFMCDIERIKFNPSKKNMPELVHDT
jgi:c-di-GMP-binding flagellar brake protein YcgR